MYKPWGGCQVRALVYTDYSYPCIALLPELHLTKTREVGGGEERLGWRPTEGRVPRERRGECPEDRGASSPKAEERRALRERRGECPEDWGANPPKTEKRRALRERRGECPEDWGASPPKTEKRRALRERRGECSGTGGASAPGRGGEYSEGQGDSFRT